jgi:hypothetical protein
LPHGQLYLNHTDLEMFKLNCWVLEPYKVKKFMRIYF